jgi:hypothetical protein
MWQVDASCGGAAGFAEGGGTLDGGDTLDGGGTLDGGDTLDGGGTLNVLSGGSHRDSPEASW